jgi:hypothetical protein
MIVQRERPALRQARRAIGLVVEGEQAVIRRFQRAKSCGVRSWSTRPMLSRVAEPSRANARSAS